MFKEYYDFFIPVIGCLTAAILGIIGLTLNGTIAGQLQHVPF